ncbi:MAG: sigma-70 family RNA polymerase sigma factor [Deltaproteobacteria bacterium]|nr:sigma-70 family RNA polymerase sigma factor [Deltaproteobacteria bacterium]
MINSDNPENDSDLVNAFKNGNHSAFEKIVLKYQDRVYNLCYRFLGDNLEAEDSAQEIFIKVYRALKGFKLKSSFYTWLYRIAINTCKNRIKSLEYRRSKSRVSIDDDQEKKDYGIPGIIDKNDLPDTNLEHKEKIKRIQEAIDSLPPDQKTMVILRDVEGLSYEEIADITKTRLGTVKSKLSRARISLRNRLEGII